MNKTLIIILVILAFLGGSSALWYWGIYKPGKEAKERARLEQIAKQQEEEKRKEQETQKKARYDQLIQDADAAFDLENWQSAQSLYSEASSLFSDQKYPQDQLVLVNAKLDEIAAIEARIASGVIETVPSPTGRFYVIISSSVDGDLANDYARKLTQEGNSVKIIEPDETNLLFHRVSIGDYGSWDQAVTATTESFNTFGEGVWVLKY